MGKCHKCGNEYDKSFEVIRGGETFTYDSFECAIFEQAPRCQHCECIIIGHGTEASGNIYCCVNCAEMDGVQGLKDRI